MIKKTLLVLMLGASVVPGLKAAESAKQVETLQKQIEMLQKQLEEISKQVKEQSQQVKEIKTEHKNVMEHKPAARVDQIVTEATKPADSGLVFEKGYMPVPGTTGAIKVYGMVKLDTIMDGRQNTGDASFLPNLPYNLQSQTARTGYSTTAPVAGYNWKRHFTMNARASTLGVKANVKNKSGTDVNAWIEFDLYGNSANGDSSPTYGNSTTSLTYQPRFRHAVLSYGGLKAGHTWTNFMFDDVSMQTVDYDGLSVGYRHALVGYTFKANAFQATAAIENPRADYVTYNSNPASVSATTSNYIYYTQGSTGNIAKPTRPDLTLSMRYDFANGSMVGLALLSRDLTIKNNNTTSVTVTLADGNKYTATGTAVNFTTKIMTFGKSCIQASYVFGRGIGSYVSELGGRSAYFNLPPATGTSTANAFYKAIPATALWAGYTHVWNNQWKTNFGTSYFVLKASTSLRQKTTQWFDPGLDKQMKRYVVNTFYSPEENLDFGLEYMFLKRTAFKQPSGFAYTGIGQRYMFTAVYKF